MEKVVLSIVGSALVAMSVFAGEWAWWKWRQTEDIRSVQKLVDEMRRLMLDARPGEIDGSEYSADELRAQQFNNFNMRLYFVLDGALPYLSYKHKTDLLVAMRWNELPAVPQQNGRLKFVAYGLPVRWPKEEMPREFATDFNERLESIKWLKLPLLED